MYSRGLRPRAIRPSWRSCSASSTRPLPDSPSSRPEDVASAVVGAGPSPPPSFHRVLHYRFVARRMKGLSPPRSSQTRVARHPFETEVSGGGTRGQPSEGHDSRHPPTCEGAEIILVAACEASGPLAADARRIGRVGLRGRLTSGAGRGRVGARDAAIGHVLGPLGSRPVTVFVPARGVHEPAGGDTGVDDRA